MIDLAALKEYPPFVGVQAERQMSLADGRRFLVIVYAGYEALGLIGTEHNGIAVLDLDQRQVVADEIARAERGDRGATVDQLLEFGRIVAMSDNDFVTYVNAQPRLRYAI